jgi:tRNA(fMet)-specific endonuclease VapC
MIGSDLTQRGLIIGPYHVLIADQARSTGLRLVTNNRREFDHVDGLRVEDWTT